LKYNHNGYFSAAIHDSVSDQSAPPSVRADGGVFSLSLKLSLYPFVVNSFVSPLKMTNKKPAHLAVGGFGNCPESSGYNLSAHLLHTILDTGIGTIFNQEIAHKTGPDHARALQPGGRGAEAMLCRYG
jgi:hypothetical protein